MEIEVVPVAITTGDIATLQRVCQDVLGYSPTRALDKTHLKITDPAAYLGCLDMEDNPLDALRQGKRRSGIWSHFYATLLAVVPSDVAYQVVNLGHLKLHLKQGKRETIIVMSGSMDEWYDAILIGCNRSVDSELRAVTTGALHCFERVGLRELFSNLVHKIMPDGTTYLVKND